MTGWRLGYSVWPKALIEQATRLAINCHSCVNAAAQYAGIAALSGPQDAVGKMVAAFAERRKVVIKELNAIPGFRCVEPGGAFYAFPNTSGTGLASRQLEAKLLDEAGVATLSGTSFGAEGEGFLRFSYANSLENIRAAMERIRTCLTPTRAPGRAIA
jgi:aspartate/methionine/tyrosine aminotransferase